MLIGSSAFAIMVPSLFSDIVDYGSWQFGRDRAGTYFTLFTFINKTVGALGGALSLALADWVGFDPAAETYAAENKDTEVDKMRWYAFFTLSREKAFHIKDIGR